VTDRVPTRLMTALIGLAIGGTVLAAPPDLTGIWMPTAIGPDGERNRTWPAEPPFREDVRPKIDAYLATYDPIEDDDGRSCLPYGLPRQMLLTAQYPLEIIRIDDLITIIYELHNDFRHVYLDGRGHPEGLLPTWMGHSVGHVDGDALVIETTGLRTLGPPRPQSPALRLTERIASVDGGERGEMIRVDITIDDPLTYREPFTVRNYFIRQTDIEMGEYFCSDDLWQQNLAGDESLLPWRE
jgi:hypothetical protein